MATSAEFTANLIHIDPIIFRSHAEANFAICQLLKKYRDNNGVDRSNVINQAIDIVRLDLQALFYFVGERHARHPIVQVERSLGQKLAEKLDSPFRIAFVQFVGNPRRRWPRS